MWSPEALLGTRELQPFFPRASLQDSFRQEMRTLYGELQGEVLLLDLE